MADEPRSESRSLADRGCVMDEALTPDARKLLGDLAVFSEECVERADSLEEARRNLASLVERHPEFDGAAKELRVKMTRLQELEAALGKAVMRYSHAYEDDVTGAERRTGNE